jgi:hypothetical protein
MINSKNPIVKNASNVIIKISIISYWLYLMLVKFMSKRNNT